jgi:hypothetical protein
MPDQPVEHAFATFSAGAITVSEALPLDNSRVPDEEENKPLQGPDDWFAAAKSRAQDTAARLGLLVCTENPLVLYQTNSPLGPSPLPRNWDEQFFENAGAETRFQTLVHELRADFGIDDVGVGTDHLMIQMNGVPTNVQEFIQRFDAAGFRGVSPEKLVFAPIGQRHLE